jgi:hypothetical protein
VFNGPLTPRTRRVVRPSNICPPIAEETGDQMKKTKIPVAKQHWLFGLAACLWPIAFTIVGICGGLPLKLAGAILGRLR